MVTAYFLTIPVVVSPEPGVLAVVQGPAILVRQHRDQEAGVRGRAPRDNKVVAETSVIRTLHHVTHHDRMSIDARVSKSPCLCQVV